MEQQITDLIDGLADRYVYEIVENALTDFGTDAVLPLIAALKRENPTIRYSAAALLGRFGDERAIEPLIAAFNTDAHANVRFNALSSLREFCYGSDQANPRIVHVLLTALSDINSSVRGQAIAILGSLGDNQAVDPIIHLFQTDTNVYTRIVAPDALSKLMDTRAVPVLIAALEDTNVHVRSNAARALGHLGDVQAISPLIRAFRVEDTDVRKTIVIALTRFGESALLPLFDALSNENSNIRFGTVMALGKIGDARVLPALHEMVTHDKGKNSSGTTIKRVAAEAIERIQKRCETANANSQKILSLPDQP